MDRELLPRASGRIVLRRLDIGDLADFQAYRGDREVARYQGWQIVPDDEAKSFLAEVNVGALLRPGHWCQIGIARMSTGRLIGDIGLFVSADEEDAEIGVSLSREAQGKGLASEAVREAMRLVFEHTAAGRLLGITDVRNLPSIRLLERVGMRKIGRQESVVKDESCTEHVFAISRGEAADLDRTRARPR